MRMMLAVIVFLVIGVGPHWEKYKNEKVAAYQAQHGGEVCKVKNIFIVVECRPFTREELEAKEQDEALQRWNDRVADAEARKRVAQQMEDLLHYGQ
jgi:hypothetical protein